MLYMFIFKFKSHNTHTHHTLWAAALRGRRRRGDRKKIPNFCQDTHTHPGPTGAAQGPLSPHRSYSRNPSRLPHLAPTILTHTHTRSRGPKVWDRFFAQTGVTHETPRASRAADTHNRGFYPPFRRNRTGVTLFATPGVAPTFFVAAKQTVYPTTEERDTPGYRKLRSA